MIFAGLACLIVVATSCEKKTGNSTGPGNGTLKVSITDSPFPMDYIASATVTVVRAEIRPAGEADTSFITIFNDSATFDLMDLRNGITDELSRTEIPAGSYDEMRLYVTSASLTLTGGETFNLKVPSGSTSGLKIKVDPPIDVQGGLTSELVLDFDLSRSFVVEGNFNTPAGIKGFIFKPVIRAVNASTSGRVEGMVTDTTGSALSNVTVWVQKDTLVAASLTDSTGFYRIIAIPAGAYDVSASMESYETSDVQGVTVTAGNSTRQDFVLVPSAASR